MKNPRRKFEMFCLRNRTKGIPNLMLYIVLGNAIVYLMSALSGNSFLYNLLYFDRTLILEGQVWRLFTYPLTYNAGNLLLTAVALLCYYSLGRAMERMWGTLKFNLFYASGIVLMDVYCMIFGGWANVSSLNMSLFLAYATMFPDATFLLLFIIPVRAWIFALVDLIFVVIDFIGSPFPYNFFSIISLANYFLFFGRDVQNILPMSWRAKLGSLFHKGPSKPKKAKVISFDRGTPGHEAPKAQASYTHKCTVCGRTDASNPELEFRYCSKCRGYYCYCQDHINNHAHIQ